VKTLEKEISFYPLRHIIKPGVTGWAQINSFYARSIDDSVEKTRYDLFYIKNHSLLFDMNILLQTIKMIFSKREKQNY
jgi:lipopolysaccharide/colanic/teichoic acid biosynthesis glycosyltransferase